jgi:hypothetical protein
MDIGEVIKFLNKFPPNEPAKKVIIDNLRAEIAKLKDNPEKSGDNTEPGDFVDVINAIDFGFDRIEKAILTACEPSIRIDAKLGKMLAEIKEDDTRDVYNKLLDGSNNEHANLVKRVLDIMENHEHAGMVSFWAALRLAAAEHDKEAG